MPRRRFASYDGPPLGDPARLPCRGHSWRVGPLVVGWAKMRRMPAVPVQVRDVCGAGDTVLGTLGVVMATGGMVADGCRQAVQTAAEQVCYVDVSPIMQRNLLEIHDPNDRTCHEAHDHNSRADSAGKPASLPTGGGRRRNPTGIADADGGILHVASFGQQSTC